MERMLLSAKSFSSMNEVVDEQFFSQCAHEYSLSLISMLVDRFGSACAPDIGYLSAILEHPIASEFDPYWCPQLGLCLVALKSNKLPAAQRGLSQIAINLLSSGIPGKWGSYFVEPSRFHFDNYMLPTALYLEIDSDGTRVRINVQGPDSRQDLCFNAIRNGHIQWQPTEEKPGVEAIPYMKIGHNRALLLSGPHCKDLGLPDPVLTGVPEVNESQKRHFSDSLALMYKHFPSWNSWFDRVVRVLSVGQKAPEGIHSGTTEGYFGLISISDSEDMLKIAESFIHEASHQYFFLLSRLVALTGDDGKLFYSPFTKSNRPADRLLLAYHAFTNVEIFYLECVKAGIDGGRCGPVLAQLKKELGYVQRVLSSEIDMTPVGQCIYDSLLAYRHSYGTTD